MSVDGVAFPDVSFEEPALPAGPIKPGTEAHKGLFCRTLLSTFDPYKPAVIDWPTLEPSALHRLTSLPIWDIAVHTERKAGLRVATYGARISDPLLKQAIALNAFEERRHKHVLHNMVKAYGIALRPDPVYAGERPPYFVFRELGGLASPQYAVLAAAMVCIKDCCGVGFPGLGEDRHRQKHRRG